MSGIFGIFNRKSETVTLSDMATMRQAMTKWGPDGSAVQVNGCIGLGQARLFSTREARYARLPYVDEANDTMFTAAARLDNREELLTACGVCRTDSEMVSDEEVIRLAYLRWGEDCVKRIYGDWSFAVYHRTERKLFLARDHYGNTALYYYADSNVFAFASSRKALQDLGLTPIELDELYLAQVLISWPAYHGENTIHKPLKRLPPAHCLTITPEKIRKHCYWHMEATPELHLPSRDAYVEGFKDIFEQAVKERLRTVDDSKTGKIGVTLSGGLDSGSVAVTAARLLRKQGQGLIAFTSVPIADTKVYLSNHSFGDELSLAQVTADYGQIALHSIQANRISPVQAIRHKLALGSEPLHAAGNLFWLQDLMATARDRGCRILLTGQLGNAGISWAGDIFSQPISYQLNYFGWRRCLKEKLKCYLPDFYIKFRMRGRKTWQESVLNPDFIQRINLHDRMLENPDSLLAFQRTMLDQRFFGMMPGRSLTGCRWAENGSDYQLDVRDPTADVRVLSFTLSIPDHIFMDPKTGVDRWLIREAMKGQLPDQVRLNRKLGRQAADLVPRLRACADEVEAVLKELAQGEAAAYVNVPYMRHVWHLVQTQDTPESFQKAVTILTKGIMAGLFVNEFNKNG